MAITERWCPGVSCCDPIWEAAYQQFESPEAEIRKFRKRLRSLGAAQWPRESRILELCCGRGNGLTALASLGFTSLNGVDLSEELLQRYDGTANLYVGDCRDLKLADRSIDIVIVQGGLHHLPDLPGDLRTDASRGASSLATRRLVCHRRTMEHAVPKSRSCVLRRLAGKASMEEARCAGDDDRERACHVRVVAQ